MEITKLIHSCILVKSQGKTVIIDPGRYGYTENPQSIATIASLDSLLISHKHGDHFYIPFIKSILKKYPQVTTSSNSEVKGKLEQESILVLLEGNEFITLDTRQHEQSFDKGAPLNSIFTLFNQLTHSGDNIEYTKKSEVMTLPIDCGMWGNVSDAIEVLVHMQPKYIIPIHDYRLKEQIRNEVYVRLVSYFKEHNIIFFPLKPGDSIDI